MSTSPQTRACLASALSDGYVVLPNAIPASMISQARALTDDALASAGGAPTSQAGAASWVNAKRKLKRHDAMLDLVNASGLLQCLAGIVGPLRAARNSQLAYRFPGERTSSDADGIASNWHTDWHIDGFTKSDHSETFETAYDFTVLLGVFLSDNLNENAGNFTVFPGAHATMQDYFRTHGAAELMRNGFGHPQETMGLKNPLQVTARAGDVLIAHPSLPHTTAPNVTQDTRRVVFFRMVSSRRAKAHGKADLFERLCNIWTEWPRVQQIVDSCDFLPRDNECEVDPTDGSIPGALLDINFTHQGDEKHCQSDQSVRRRRRWNRV